jgi:hypothetical protein|tara:strand:+ start:826 stop:966 length:141 start_codon:yes stop_codon:yes gene_type:complete
MLMVTNLKLPQAMNKYYHALDTIQQSSPTPLREMFRHKNSFIAGLQ